MMRMRCVTQGGKRYNECLWKAHDRLVIAMEAKKLFTGSKLSGCYSMRDLWESSYQGFTLKFIRQKTDKLSVSVEESSSEHKQGLNPERERERELHSRTLLQCYKNLIHLSKVALQKQDL
jgi:hypothetical protein